MKTTYISEQAQISTPSNPDENFTKLYQKSDGFWYDLDNVGNEVRIFPAYTYTTHAGRITCQTDNRWVKISDSQGFYSQNISQNEGTGTDPAEDFADIGELFLPAGTIMHSFDFIGRFSNDQATGFNLVLCEFGDNFLTTGYDNISEANRVDIFTGSVLMTIGDSNDIQRNVVNLGDHVITRDCFVNAYYQPIGTITTTIYWQGLRQWKYTLPKGY
jgi:hypothetical protein